MTTALQKHMQPSDIIGILAVVITIALYLVTREDVFKQLCVVQLAYLAGVQRSKK